MKNNEPIRHRIFILSIAINLFLGYRYFSATYDTSPSDANMSADASQTFLSHHLLSQKTGGQKTFTLTEQGKKIITNVRALHKAPTLLAEEKFSEGLCAGYLYELTAGMRGLDVPYKIGMMHPKTKQAADARELPYSYWYLGGTIPIEIDKTIGKKLKKHPNAYPSLISASWLKEFFIHAFDAKSAFGDIGFLYPASTRLAMLGTYNNFNTHIAKNFGVSSFSMTIKKSEDRTAQIIKRELNCSDDMRLLIKSLLPYYTRKINGKATSLSIEENEIVLRDIHTKQKISVHVLDTISYDDITVVHFFYGAHVDSLLQMICQGQFYPTNIIQINPVFLETI